MKKKTTTADKTVPLKADPPSVHEQRETHLRNLCRSQAGFSIVITRSRYCKFHILNQQNALIKIH